MAAGVIAPLVSIPEAPAPPRSDPRWFKGSDGARLRAALFSAPGSCRGSVVLNLGRTEVIEQYFEVIEELQGRGFTVLVHDWRGQGLSKRFVRDASRGHARGWRLFLNDLDALLDAFAAELPRPWIALGHSMGGSLTLLALAEGEQRFSGALLSAPMLGLRGLGRRALLARFWSWFEGVVGQGAQFVYANRADQWDGRFEDNVLTHDAVRWARWQAQRSACPALRLGSITWGWLAFALTVIDRINGLRALERIAVPVVVVAAGEDRLCLSAAARAVAQRMPRGRYVEVEGALHEILMETDSLRAVLWQAFDALADQLAPVTS